MEVRPDDSRQNLLRKMQSGIRHPSRGRVPPAGSAVPQRANLPMHHAAHCQTPWGAVGWPRTSGGERAGPDCPFSTGVEVEASSFASHTAHKGNCEHAIMGRLGAKGAAPDGSVTHSHNSLP
jgi:hypothetical protein